MNCLISFQLVIRQFPLIFFFKKRSNAYTQAKDTAGCKHPWQNILALAMVTIAWQIFRGLLGSVEDTSPLGVYLPG